MKFIIHRGTEEIGGTCIEIWDDHTRLVVDLGMPLVDTEGDEYNYEQYSDLTIDKKIKAGVLPNIASLYNGKPDRPTAVLISHYHKDHWGLVDSVQPGVTGIVSNATREILELTELLANGNGRFGDNFKTIISINSGVPFHFGTIKITPYLVDHSAFDAYAFLIECNGKRLFYSGDFRGHGRKEKLFKWFLHNAPKNVDYLLMEGTVLGRTQKKFKREAELEVDIANRLKSNNGCAVVYTSAQNIDRLVTLYRACKKAGKTFVVDIYTAQVLGIVSQHSSIMYPSEQFKDLKVFYPYYLSKRIGSNLGKESLYKFKNFKITRQEIDSNPNEYVMMVRASMRKDLDLIPNLKDGIFIYSMWEGYKEQDSMKKFLQFFKDRGCSIESHHTSGHADIDDLNKFADAIAPKQLVPIHTFNKADYSRVFNHKVLAVNDGDLVAI